MTTPDQTKSSSESTSQEVDPNLEELEEIPQTTETLDGAASDESLEVVPAQGTPDFSNPMLAGKTREEIEILFETQQKAIAEQNQELNRMHAATQQSAPPPEAKPVEEEDPYGDDFMSSRFRAQETRMRTALQEAIAPLVAETKARGTNTARDNMRKKYQHFATLEPHIDKLLRDQGMDPNGVSESDLGLLYHTAVGMATEQGINLGTSAPAPTNAEPFPTEAPPMAIPQHRPSSAPVPERAAPTRRKLTENERLLAHAQFGHHKDPEGEYLRLQNMDEDDVVQPGFSKDRW